MIAKPQNVSLCISSGIAGKLKIDSGNSALTHEYTLNHYNIKTLLCTYKVTVTLTTPDITLV